MKLSFLFSNNFYFFLRRIKGRAGSGGAWRNITQSHKNDGKSLVFVNNSIAGQSDPKVNVPRQTTSGRKLTKAYLAKLELGKNVLVL